MIFQRKEKWFLNNYKGDASVLSGKMGISRTLARLLINRGCDTAEKAMEFLNPLNNELTDPFSLADMQRGAEILADALGDQQKILVVGDYDVDGIMSLYILCRGIMDCEPDADIDYMIPDRKQEGYGINISIVEKAASMGVDLIITCDNGTAAHNALQKARELGIQVVVTDHHEIQVKKDTNGLPIQDLPPALAVINPMRLDCTSSCKDLCGAAVAFKLVLALYTILGMNPESLQHLLQYVAVATICDISSMLGENRTLTAKGLQILNQTENTGLKALMEVNGISGKDIGTYAVGYILGPCFNAAGRLETAELAVRLLFCSETGEAESMARRLVQLNRERQAMTSEGSKLVFELIRAENLDQQGIIVAFLPQLHESVAGIVAGRVRDAFCSPSIVLTRGVEEVKGSGRSIEGYDMFQALTACKEQLTRYGGHAMAAGMSLQEEQIPPFIENICNTYSWPPDHGCCRISIDMILPFRSISEGLVREIQVMEPEGKGNPKPLFGLKEVAVFQVRRMGREGKVFRVAMIHEGTCMEGLLLGTREVQRFSDYITDHAGVQRMTELENGTGPLMMDIAYQLEMNTYQGREQINLIIKNYRIRSDSEPNTESRTASV
ncbi:MAG TPA: single-stranded-DNA-specific exonuclease RecJ [Clostridiales bacterium]|nr:single-stranded-DNA-specific exonuclease RecJ [Clostridiales bacterium]